MATEAQAYRIAAIAARTLAGAVPSDETAADALEMLATMLVRMAQAAEWADDRLPGDKHPDDCGTGS